MSKNPQRRAVLFLVGLCAAVGCESTPAASGTAAAAPQQGVVITGAHGGTAVFMKTADPQRPAVMTGGSMVLCETCKKDVIRSFQTGELVPVCPDCGATRTKVSMVNPAIIGHQQ